MPEVFADIALAPIAVLLYPLFAVLLSLFFKTSIPTAVLLASLDFPFPTVKPFTTISPPFTYTFPAVPELDVPGFKLISPPAPDDELSPAFMVTAPAPETLEDPCASMVELSPTPDDAAADGTVVSAPKILVLVVKLFPIDVLFDPKPTVPAVPL